MNRLQDLHTRLEFDKVCDIIGRDALSDEARQRIIALPFLSSHDEIQLALDRVIELADILRHEENFPLEIWEIKRDLEVASVDGNYLQCDGLVRIASTLAASRRLRQFVENRSEKYPSLWIVAHDIHVLRPLEKSIAGKIDFEAFEVKSAASPELSRLRKEIQRMQARARKSMESLFRQAAASGYLQDSVLNLKDGRLVFPLKLEHKGKVKGLVHDQSASGATLFVEPLESVEMNNEIHRLKGQELREIERILKELTSRVRFELEAIIQNLSILIEFDFLHAKAVFSKRFDCVKPALNSKNLIRIVSGKHPLLLVHKKDGQAVVPLDMEIGPQTNTVVISGPNAGGKSVALKTVGLLALMTHSGVPIPAHEDSSLPVFDGIFADIGDYQSIENDLSTFTSHIRNIRRILEAAGERSLVLLDEIGVGTDPDEGSALSIALLEMLTKRGCQTVVTTHHGSLKAFAYNTPHVQNGSMEFDASTLRPTFRFKAGVPGSSYALEISKRLGLPGSMLKRSHELLGSEKHDLERLILDLEGKTQATDLLSERLGQEQRHLDDLKKLYEGRLDSIKQEGRRLKQEALHDSQQILSQSNAVVEQAVREIREKQAGRETVAKARKSIEAQQHDVTQKLKAVTRAGGPATPDSQQQPAAIEAGAEVLWQAQKQVGRIVEVQDGGAKVLLQLGNMKVWVPSAELSAAPRSKTRTRQASGTVRVEAEAKDSVLPEIDVRGQSLDDATRIVDKFLDDALLASWEQVRIIHGKGTGVLRKGLTAYLDKHPRVRSHEMGAWNAGDLGVTIAKLD